MPVGQLDLNPVISADRMNLDSQRYAAQGYIDLGNQISQSITIQNARKEAQQIAPQLAQSYGQGAQAISNGDIAGGLSQIYQTSAGAMTNPLLAPLAHQANQEAQSMAGQYMNMQKTSAVQEAISNRQEAGLTTRENIAQQGMNTRTQIAESNATARQQLGAQHDENMADRQQNNIQLKNQLGAATRQPSVTEKLKTLDTFQKQSDGLIDTLKKSDDPEEMGNAYTQYENLRNVLQSQQLNLPPDAAENVLHDKLQKIDTQLQQYKQSVDSGQSTWASVVGGKDYKSLIDNLQDTKNKLISYSRQEVKSGRSVQPQQQQDSNAQPQGQQQQPAQAQPQAQVTPQDQSQAAPQQAPPTVTTKAQFDALPSGAVYISKNGQPHKKP